MAFCASADGTRLPAIILIPRATPLPDFVAPDNTIVIYESGANFNSKVIKDEFISSCLIPHLLRNKIKRPNLVWDQAKCHTADLVTTHLKKNKIGSHFIPAGFTNLLQPADVSWMR